MNDIKVFGVGLVVSSLVVLGVFSQVVSEMQDAKGPEVAPVKGEE